METFLSEGQGFSIGLGVHLYSSSLDGRSCWEGGARRRLGEVYELFKECCSSSKAELSSVTGSTEQPNPSGGYYSQCSTVTLIHVFSRKT